MSLASIQKEIVQLNPRERAMLIDLLWESLDEARIKEIEARWASESEDRIDAYERGELSAIDGPAALRDLRSSQSPPAHGGALSGSHKKGYSAFRYEQH
ncbi:MAG: addiction module protein [bacterium]